MKFACTNQNVGRDISAVYFLSSDLLIHRQTVGETEKGGKNKRKRERRKQRLMGNGERVGGGGA